MIHSIDRQQIENEINQMNLDDRTKSSLLMARLKAVDIIERLDPDDITGWHTLHLVLENSLNEVKKVMSLKF